MNPVYKFVASIKSQFIKPKVYALLVKTGSGSFVSLQAAFSLEEAYGYASVEFKKDNPNWNINDSKIEIFTHKDIGVLFSQFTEVSLEETEKEEDRNQLMQRIIDSKDRKLLEKNKSTFSKEELRYLEDKMADITKTKKVNK